MPTSAISKFVNVNEAAEIIGCTPGRVRQLLRSGDLDGSKVNDRAWLIRTRDAERIRDTKHAVGRKRNAH